MNNWYKENRGAIMIVSFSFLGILLIIFSCLINDTAKYGDIWKTILAGIGGTITTGGIASIFLNLPETKKYIASTITNLFTSGEIINSLNYKQRSLLNKKIITNNINIPIDKMNNDLFDRIQKIQKNCLRDFHFENYSADFTINDSKTYDGYVEEEQLISYRVIADHMPLNIKKEFKITSEYVFPVYDETHLTKDDFVLTFQCKIGNVLHEKEEVEISEFKKDNVRFFKYKFENISCISTNLDVELKVKLVKPLIDRAYSLYVRYPTKGYSARLSYNNSCNYSCNWFRFWDKENDFIDSVTDGKNFLNGISVTNREWMLPGEGLVLEFKRNSDNCSTCLDKPRQKKPNR